MSITAADIMTTPPVVVGPRSSMAEVAALLASRHFSAVPVCREDGSLVGMVSESDILRPFRESVRARRDWWLGVLADGEQLPQDFLDYIRQDRRTAGEIMTQTVITTTEDASLPELAEVMIKNTIKRLPVVRDGKLVGIVSRSDLVRAIATSPGMLT